MIKEDAHAAYDRREAEVREVVMRELERRVVLSVLDRKWREHLYEMDYLREGIYLRAYSQRDPLVEYQREGFEMFASMMEGIKEEAVGFLFNLDVQVEEEEEETSEDEDEVIEPMRQPVPSGDAPADPGQGPGPAEPAAEPLLLRAQRGRRGRGSWRSRRGGGRVRRHRSQRQVPLRLRQEVQAVPRPPRRSDRPDGSHQSA